MEAGVGIIRDDSGLLTAETWVPVTSADIMRMETERHPAGTETVQEDWGAG